MEPFTASATPQQITVRNLQAGDEIAHAPVGAEHLPQADPQRGEPLVFLVEPLHLIRLAPKARTTRTPVRFSCTAAERSPSASSAVRKRAAIFE